ncbi:hypothetical protein [Flavobacterium quisquiliarum]|uniref:Uncharacterized protein n=1 Tax=Flavobacterium quisquiliarum TaxID=1834436 RepID=A0ABV8W1W2_9FLAO|nr:hypothetical protein [Flavobacterium quisquiliarum]MBW1658794.1 hypothetical protein [Flavobacterium quisquiliarum]NWL02963.1 hypothetical protein [Flavobacterium collinsii]
MANFTKTQMLYEDQYTWRRDGGDGPYIGKIDRDRLDRDEGYEVLDFANSCLKSGVGVEALHKFERLLREKLPSNVVMKNQIIDFLNKNW